MLSELEQLLFVASWLQVTKERIREEVQSDVTDGVWLMLSFPSSTELQLSFDFNAKPAVLPNQTAFDSDINELEYSSCPPPCRCLLTNDSAWHRQSDQWPAWLRGHRRCHQYCDNQLPCHFSALLRPLNSTLPQLDTPYHRVLRLVATGYRSRDDLTRARAHSTRPAITSF